MTWCKLLVLFGVSIVESAFLRSSLYPFPPILDNRHTIMCKFELDPGETVTALKLYLGTKVNASNIVAQINSSTGQATWSHDVPDELNQRGYLLGSREESSLHMVIDKTECSDRHRKYLCELEVSGSGSAAAAAATKLAPISELSELRVPPIGPTTMTQTPDTMTVKKAGGGQVTYLCKGDVGRPAGILKWRIYFASLDNTSDNWENLAGESVKVCEEVSRDRCSYSLVSRLRLTLPLRRTQGKEVYFPGLQNSWVECFLEQTGAARIVSKHSDPTWPSGLERSQNDQFSGENVLLKVRGSFVIASVALSVAALLTMIKTCANCFQRAQKKQDRPAEENPEVPSTSVNIRMKSLPRSFILFKKNVRYQSKEQYEEQYEEELI